MASVAEPEHTLGVREQIARVDKMQAELAKLQVDTKLAVWPVVTGAVTASAALFGAGFRLPSSSSADRRPSFAGAWAGAGIVHG